MANFIGLFNFKWRDRNKVGNIDILVLLGDREKLGIAQELTDALMPNGINWNVV